MLILCGWVHPYSKQIKTRLHGLEKHTVASFFLVLSGGSRVGCVPPAVCPRPDGMQHYKISFFEEPLPIPIQFKP